MTAGTGCDVVWGTERLLLTGERAVIWPAERIAFVADVHLGKESVFRRHGLAVPDGPTGSNLSRLSEVVRRHACRRVIVLGDFMHAPPGRDDTWPASVTSWLDQHDGVEMEVVAGNHDRASGRLRLDRRIRWHAGPLTIDPFVLTHEPARPARGFAICGHVHPVVRLRVGAERLRAPAYWYRGDSAVLPAFGRFTGGHAIRPGRGDRVWLVDDGAVVEWPGTAGRRS